MAARPAPRLRRVLQMATANEAAGVTNAKYWDKAAEDWDDFQDTFATDDSGVIKRALSVHCNRFDECIDFGCGGGRYLAFLASRVRTILGLDVSQALLDIAQKDIVSRAKLANVILRCADLGANGSVTRLNLPRCDLAICANVIISPEPTTRGNILRLMATSVRDGGTLFLVVPSVSSAVNIRSQHGRWLKERRRLKMPRNSEAEAGELTNPADEHRGIYQRAGVRTKHYTAMDLQTMLHAHGFHPILSLERVEYSWDCEFERPTKFLDRDRSVDRPFDWCVVARRSSDPPALTEEEAEARRAKHAAMEAAATAAGGVDGPLEGGGCSEEGRQSLERATGKWSMSTHATARWAHTSRSLSLSLSLSLALSLSLSLIPHFFSPIPHLSPPTSRLPPLASHISPPTFPCQLSPPTSYLAPLTLSQECEQGGRGTQGCDCHGKAPRAEHAAGAKLCTRHMDGGDGGGASDSCDSGRDGDRRDSDRRDGDGSGGGGSGGGGSGGGCTSDKQQQGSDG